MCAGGSLTEFVMEFLEERFQRQEVLEHVISQTRVVNHDAHRVQRPLEARKAQSLPPPRRNGYLVTSEYLAPDRDRGRYHGDEGQARKEAASHSRQLSLPFKNTKAENRRDKARSAPSHQDAPPQGVPAPRVNNFLSGASLYGGDSGQVSKGFAGVPTRHQDESHLKSNKFASSWAQVRAENHIEVTASNERGNDPATEAVKTHDSTKHSPRKTEKTTSPFHARPREEPEKSRASKPHPGRATHAQSRDSQATKSQQGHLFHARPREEGNDQSMEPTAAQQPTSRLSTKSGQSKSEKDAQAGKLVSPTEVDGIKDGFRDSKIKENEVDGRNPRANGAERMPGKRRPAWNDRLALNPEAVQPTRGSWRRYEAELTYKPTTTSTQNIQKAYLAPPKTITLDTGDDVDKVSPRQLPTAGEPTAGDEETVTSEGNPGDKEYILSRAEARMFLQMQETYGSDAFLTARKKRFFNALLEVQKQEEKRQVEEQRRRKKKMEESKKRQHRQLLYVRRKYRAEQAHRFRTQYVTLRVFERKRADRLMYGLPDDSDDEIFDGTGIEDQEADGKEKSNIVQDKNNSRHENGGGMQTAAAKNMADKHDPIRTADSDENNPKHQSPQRKVTFSPDKGTDQSPSGHPLDSHTNEQSVKHSEKSDVSGNGSSKTALVKSDPRMAGDDNKETSVKVEESGSNNKSATTEYEAGSPNKKSRTRKNCHLQEVPRGQAGAILVKETIL
ncbi:uncharacterized protein LOC112565040 isoform X1 [Pomacea canaliculata]|uniref:uncharacterized protein LOC112565040 isoform X1 n=1 Tax=Pomacea canaliculata TaxID=400727 RepID=UPI000D73C681|nr:uncharacterized protein LOC112565040 isoform X1 [Pomacea canaliculata]